MDRGLVMPQCRLENESMHGAPKWYNSLTVSQSSKYQVTSGHNYSKVVQKNLLARHMGTETNKQNSNLEQHRVS